MDFELSDDQELLRETVRRFLEAEAPVTPYVRGMLEDPRGTSDGVWKGLVELGLPGLLVPEAHGGAGLGMQEMGVVLEEMGRAVHPGPFASSALAATKALLEAADAEQAAELLPPLAAGDRVATLGVYEPGSRYAWEHPRTSAGGSDADCRVSGEKSFVPDAGAADWLVVSARDDGGGGALGLFVVEREAPGVEVEPRPLVDGTRRAARVVLRSAPARRLAGGPGAQALAAALDLQAVGLAADGVGAAERALELAVAYARERVQFGQPVGSFQAVQHLLVDMLRDVELGRAAAYYAFWAADCASPAERARAAALAKAFASEAFPRIGADAIQTFGGVGFTWEYDVHLYYKRLLGLQSVGGDAAWHLETLARTELDAPAAPEAR